MIETEISKKGLWLAYLTLAFCILSCAHNEPLHGFDIGSPLSKDLIGQCDQFWICTTPLTVIFNPHPDVESYDPYLLVFDKNQKLAGASYFPSERVDRVERDTIYCRLNHDRKNRYLERQEGVSGPYVITYDTILHRILRKSSFIIEQFTVQEMDCNVLLVGRTASDPFAGLKWIGRKPEPRIYDDFDEVDSIRIELSQMVFDKSEGIITRPLPSQDRNLWFDDMIVSSDSLWEMIFLQIWQQCQRQIH